MNCLQCSYNLRGLPISGKCPECSRPISQSVRRTSTEQPLVEAPVPWLTKFAWGARLTSFAYFGLISLIVLEWFVDVPGIDFIPAVLSCCWAWGLYLVTMPRPIMKSTTVAPKIEWAKTRLVTRILSVGWLLFFAMSIWEDFANPTSNALTFLIPILQLILLLGGFISAIFFCIYAQNLADWGRDEDLGHQFRASAFSLVVGFIVIALNLFVESVALVSLILSGFFALALLGLVLYFGRALWQFSSMAHWAVRNHISADMRTDRLREKAIKAALTEQREQTLRMIDNAKSNDPKAKIRPSNHLDPNRPNNDPPTIPLAPQE